MTIHAVVSKIEAERQQNIKTRDRLLQLIQGDVEAMEVLRNEFNIRCDTIIKEFLSRREQLSTEFEERDEALKSMLS